MRKFSSIIVLVTLLLPVQTFACRCAERPLADYYAAADVVVIAKLISVKKSGNERSLTFEAVSPAHKGSPSLVDEKRVVVTTAASTAACGLQGTIDATYVVFARQQKSAGGRSLRADSCNGTRVYRMPGNSDAYGFVDVPARFVVAQLNGMAGAAVLQQVASRTPLENDPDNRALLGLLDLPALANGNDVPVHASPHNDSERIAVIQSYAEVESREFSYEKAGAVIFTRLSDWSRIRLSDGRFGWIENQPSDRYLPYAELPQQRLSYLTASWSGWVWPGPGSGLPNRHSRVAYHDASEVPVEVIDKAIIGGMPWFRVSIYGSDVCADIEPRKTLTGWVPAYGADGNPLVWFWSRGC